MVFKYVSYHANFTLKFHEKILCNFRWQNDVLIFLEHIFPNTYQGIIYALYPATRWILAVLEFGTIGSVDGWEALGSSRHAQHAQHRHSFVIRSSMRVSRAGGRAICIIP